MFHNFKIFSEDLMAVERMKHGTLYDKDFEDTPENEEMKKAKGISTRVAKKELCHEDYKQCL